ncbi:MULTISPECIES: TonB-dependent siderophore receptor [Methylomicrobium]|uniref:TonB-dependent siderophore receptor n=1 Tax=Methylomicrobium TaxID=39773 RepID=UPI001FDF8024|nr:MULTISPECIES: TonB-dependent siderophore receptor [Methylomicrobium]
MLTTTWSAVDLAAEEIQGESGAAAAGIVTPDAKQSSDIKSEEVLPTVSVVGQKEAKAIDPVKGYVVKKSLSGSKTDTPLIEVPQSISVINKDEFAARAAQSITQAVTYTPGVFTGMFGPSTRDDYFNLRGFEGTQYLDGTRLMSSSTSYAQLRVEPYGLERIEVLRGPSSVLYGQNAPGGLVNMMSKRPTAIPFHEVQFLGGSYDRVQGSLDLSGPVAGRDDLLYRLVALGRGSDTQVDFVEDNRYYVAPSFTWKPSDATTFTFLSHYQKDETGNAMQFFPYQGSVLGNPNGRLPTSRFLGEPGFDGYEREQFSVGYALEHRFNKVFSARQNVRYAHVESQLKGMFPYYGAGFLDSDQGLSGQRLIDRDAGIYQDDTGTFTLDNQLQADFATGDVQHTFLAGLDYRHFTGKRQTGYVFSASSLDAYNPTYGRPLIDPSTGLSFSTPNTSGRVNQQLDQIGFYGQDQLKWNRWVATIGVRYDWASVDTLKTDYQNEDIGTNIVDYAHPTYTPSRQDSEAFTYRTGLSYQFDTGFAPYYSYSESFDPAVGTDRSSKPFKPTTGRQHEVGIKYQPTGYNAFITAAFFHLVQENVLTPDLAKPFPGMFQKQTGEVRSQGVELEGKASLDWGLNMTAAYTYTDAKVMQSNNEAELGKNLTYTPEHQASLWMDYTHPQGEFAGLGLGGGLRYIGSNYGDLSNSQKAPAYILMDASVHYDLGRLDRSMQGLRLGVNMSNLLDHEYVVTCGDDTCYYGDRRSVLASLRYNW